MWVVPFVMILFLLDKFFFDFFIYKVYTFPCGTTLRGEREQFWAHDRHDPSDIV